MGRVFLLSDLTSVGTTSEGEPRDNHLPGLSSKVRVSPGDLTSPGRDNSDENARQISRKQRDRCTGS
jgi:hypothetical protein